MRQVFMLFLLISYPDHILAQHADSMRNRLKSAGDHEKISLLNELSKGLRNDSPASAMLYARRAYDLARSLRNCEGEIKALRNIGVAWMELGRFHEAIPNFNRAVKKSTSCGAPEDPLLAELIGCCYKATGKNQEAVVSFLKALEIHRKNGTENRRYNLVFSLAMIYAEWGWHEQALLFYGQAFNIQIADHDSAGAAYTLENMAGIYGKSLGFMKGLEYHQMALDMFKKLKDPRGMGYVLNGIGNYYKSLGRYDSALISFREAASSYGQIRFYEGMSFVYGNMGEVFLGLTDYRNALHYFTRSFTLADSGKSEVAKCTALTAMGKIYMHNGEIKKATGCFQQGLEIARARNFKEAMADNYSELSKAYKRSGNYELALKYYQYYNETRDSLYRENSQRVIAEMEARYSTERRERQIEYLTRENELNKLAILSKDRLTRISVLFSIALLILLSLLTRFYILKIRANNNYVRLTVEQLRNEKSMADLSDAEPVPRSQDDPSGIEPGPETMVVNHRLIADLKTTMARDRLYLDPDLSLMAVALKLNTNTAYLSRAINEVLNKNFSAYINELRVREAQFMLSESKYANLSMTGIALTAGFNSKSTFHSAFKKYTGVTPSFFQQSALKHPVKG